MGPDAGVEAAHPEEDGIGAVLDRGLGAIPFPRRREHFGLTEDGLEGDGGHRLQHEGNMAERESEKG
jgi:hypothetical protein